MVDHTPFHGWSGGQVGDSGNVFKDDIQLELMDSIKPLPSLILHKVKVLDGKVAMAAGVTKDLTHRFHAGNIIKEIATIVGGSGGGRPDMAQAGGTHTDKLDEALKRAEEIIKAIHE